jgi:hypothetical protein
MKKRCFLSTTAAFKLKTATPYANNMGLGATLSSRIGYADSSSSSNRLTLNERENFSRYIDWAID